MPTTQIQCFHQVTRLQHFHSPIGESPTFRARTSTPATKFQQCAGELLRSSQALNGIQCALSSLRSQIIKTVCLRATANLISLSAAQLPGNRLPLLPLCESECGTVSPRLPGRRHRKHRAGHPPRSDKPAPAGTELSSGTTSVVQAG